MISLKDNSQYVEQITEQEPSQDNWLQASDTTIGYTAPEAMIVEKSTNKYIAEVIKPIGSVDTKFTLVTTNDDMVDVVVNEDKFITDLSELRASDAQDNDYYGRSVAISANGLVCIVGAYGSDTGASVAGNIYTYRRDTIKSPWIEVCLTQASDKQESDQYGISCSVSKDGLVCIVGANAEDTGVTDAGKVYTYKRDTIADAWTEICTTQASDKQESDDFGTSVSVANNGLVLVVGAYVEDTAASNAGKVYTYKRDTVDDTWTEVNQLTASDAEGGDGYGSDISVANNGLVLVVGAYVEDTAASNAGKVYTYKRDTVDDAWTEVNQLTASDAFTNDKFGYSISINTDGTILLVGAPLQDPAGTNSGKAYLYKRDNVDAAWVEIQSLYTSTQTNDDHYGSGVAICDNSIIIGADLNDGGGTNRGVVYSYYVEWDKVLLDQLDPEMTLYDETQLTASDAASDDYFGKSTSITADGLTMVVGSPHQDTDASNAGKVYTYKRDTVDDTWTEVNQLTASDSAAGYQFGYSLNISDDGLSLVVGGYMTTGRVYTYRRNTLTDNWIEVSKLDEDVPEDSGFFGSGVALGNNGLTLIVGTLGDDTNGADDNDNRGKISTYVRDNLFSEWTMVSQTQASNASSGAYYGGGTTISSDGLVCVIGAYMDSETGTQVGAVYTYIRNDIHSDWREVSIHTPEDDNDNDHFGIAVSLSDDALTLFVGSYDQDSGAADGGKLYIYNRTGLYADWELYKTYYPSDISGNDDFAISISIAKNSNIIVIGSMLADKAASEAGKVYTYKIGNKANLVLNNNVINQPISKILKYGNVEVGMCLKPTNEHITMIPNENISMLKRSNTDGSSITTFNDFEAGDIVHADGVVAEVSAKDSLDLSMDIDPFEDGSVLAHYPLDSDATDLTERYDGTENGEASYERATVFGGGYIGSGNGTGTNIHIPFDIIGGTVKNLNTSFTFSVWAKLDYGDGTTPSSADPVLEFGGSSNNIAIGLVNGVWRFHIENNDVRKYVDDVTVSEDGVFRHAVGVYDVDNEKLSLYVDTVLVGSLDLNGFRANSGATEATIGTKSSQTCITSEDAVRDFQGTIDQIRIIGKACTHDEVKILHKEEANIMHLANHNLNYKPTSVYKQGNLKLKLENVTSTSSDILDLSETYTNNILTNEATIVDENNIVISNASAILNKSYPNIDIMHKIDTYYASDAQESDGFGTSVSVSGNGLVLVVGAVASNAGKVYTYKRATMDDPWVEVNQLIASDTRDNMDYYTSSLSYNGLVMVVSALRYTDDSQGKVYTYKRDTVNDDWSEVTTIGPSGTPDYFGRVSLSLNGLVLIVGAHYINTRRGKMYTYKRDTVDDAWTEVNQLTASDAEDEDRFGVSVSLSGDGLCAVVCAMTTTESVNGTDIANAGTVYTYRRDTIADAWTEISKITAYDVEAEDRFGTYLVVSVDGLALFVTNFRQNNKLYSYTRDTIYQDWVLNSDIELNIGATDYPPYLDISSDVKYLFVGNSYDDTKGTDAGAFYVYNIPTKNNLTITYDDTTTAPTKLVLLDNSTNLDLVSSVYSNGSITNVYKTQLVTGRSIQRRITTSKRNTRIDGALQTQLYMG